MARRHVCLLLTGMALASLLVAGCSQTDDIIAPVGSTTLTLDPERLPTTPTGMIYEMWVSTASDTLSLGKFYYNFDSLKFYEPSTGSPLVERSNQFTYADDLLRTGDNGSRVYKKLLVSVETYPNDPSLDPGPIMLVDDITNASNDPIEMVFPLSDSLWQSTVRFNMEGVSDRSRSSGEGSGVWFSSYRLIQVEIADTTSLDIDTSEVQIDTNQPGAKETYYISGIKNIHPETTVVKFGRDTLYFGDTLRQIVIRFQVDSLLPTPPYRKPVFGLTWNGPSHFIDLHVFNQDDYALPDYSPIGWHYKGWVVSNQVPTTSVGQFTPPAWPYNSMLETRIPGWFGGLLTTGVFNRVDTADIDGNPFALANTNPLYQNVPLFPGEDFLNSVTMQNELGISSLDLVPGNGSGQGAVFITLEPSNMPTTTTNFPLLLMTQKLPTSPIPIEFDTVQVDMINQSRSVRHDLVGFPQINVSIERF